jgi:hypothetical protein
MLQKGIKELSPPHALFLLEFQIAFDKEAKVFIIKYVPHRFYHRHARKQHDYATQDFISVLATQKDIKRTYLCHVESGKAHAFGAIKSGESWWLMDSLQTEPVPVKDETQLWQKNDLAGRASVMIVPDLKRESIVVGTVPLR